MSSSILVAYASSHGSTREIAERIATRLAAQFPPPSTVVDCQPVDAVRPLAQQQQQYAAVVVGSAIHAGRWLGPGRRFMARNGAYLSGTGTTPGVRPPPPPPPLWAFSVGMPRDETKRRDEEAAMAKSLRAHLVGEATLRGHALFRGRFERADAPWFVVPFLWLVARDDKKTFQDLRDWDQIDAWADQVGGEMRATGVGKGIAANGGGGDGGGGVGGA